MSDDSDLSTSWWKKLWAFFLGPFALVFAAGAIVLGAVGGGIVSIFNKGENAYVISGILAGVAYI
jgi:hypothetical protein